MLREIGELDSVSGLENPVREYLLNDIQGYCDKTWVDSMGNLHAEKSGACGKSILITTYMDEPGIIVTQITDDGYLKFDTVGRIRPEFLVSKRIKINGQIGIISLKAVHLVSKKERETPVKISQLFIDIGANSKEEAATAVEIGDYGTFCTRFSEIGGRFIKGRALGGKIGCAAAAKLLKNDLSCNLHVIFAVQREIGCRGMIAASWQIKADYAIVLDGIDAKLWDKKEEKPSCGSGAVVIYRTGAGLMDKELSDRIKRTAQEHGVSVQTYNTDISGQEAILRRAGTDMRCICLGVPVRYSQSTVQTVCGDDIDALNTILEILTVK